MLLQVGGQLQAGGAALGLIAFLLALMANHSRLWTVDTLRWVEFGVGWGGAMSAAVLVMYGIPW